MKELTGFMKVFQTINSDIHAIAQCSQKVGSPHFSVLAYAGLILPRGLAHILQVSAELQWGLMLLNYVHKMIFPY
jgi:hypothetical protein